MYRIFNLIQKRSLSKDKIRPIQPTKSGQHTLGMREEVRAYLKSKSAISSLSFSSAGGECAHEGVDERCAPKDHQEELGKHATLGGDSKCLGLSASPTAFKASKSCEGHLIARIVPEKYSDYDTHKPLAQIDPAPLIKSLLSWQMQTDSLADSTSLVDHEFDQKQQEIELLTQSDEDAVVVMDLYLLRSAYLDQSCWWKEKDTNKTLQQQREQRARSLISSFDVTRNCSSHKRNLPKSQSVQSHPTEDATVSTSSSFAKGVNCDLSSNNLFFLHMKRSPSELFTGTLRRLELSTTRKLQSLNPFPYQGKKNGSSNGSSKKVNRGKEGNLAIIHKATSSKLVLLENVGDGEMRCREVDLDHWSNAEIIRMFSNNGGCWAVALTIPKIILPWKDKDNDDDTTTAPEDSMVGSSVYSSSSASPFETVETVSLAITSNPPTILKVSTFESFTGYNFTRVPLVVETTVINATRAVITWFVDGQIALHDSKMYTPVPADIGKRISVLVTPIRPGHSGEGCQEAYAFSNAVEALPVMPIMELRENWCRGGQGGTFLGGLSGATGSITMQNNLRVATYNILADLYAGREIDSQLMYGHCDVDDLVRQRRMPMIIAEILFYKADIICLQEVDAAVHNALLCPVLEANGYQGFYSNKVSSQQEGCSMFWSLATFENANREDMRTFPLRSLLDREKDGGDENAKKEFSRQSSNYYDAKSNIKDFELERWESIGGINRLFDDHDETRKVFKESVGQIVQIARLKPKQSLQDCSQKPKSIVVANTHLFYHPMADHLRVIQAFAVCHKLDEIRREGHSPDPILICGDFNSGPLSGAVRLLTHRSVLPDENDCWKHLNVYRWECGDNEYMMDHGYICNYTSPDEIVEPCYIDEQFVDAHSDEESLAESSVSNKNEIDTSSDEMIASIQPPAIELPSSFPILSSGCLNVPKFTNFAVDFVETLDYVFASKPSDREPFGFKPKGEAPMLTEEMVKKYVAMPNRAMPSDHVAIVCDFEWVKNEV